MKAVLGFAGLLVVLGIGYLIYSSQIEHISSDDRPLKQQIDLVAIKGDLLSLAQAEQLYLAGNGRYGSLDQLRKHNMMNSFPPRKRSGYEYSAEVDGAEYFQITASPIDTSREDLPTFFIDKTMQITQ